MPEIAEVALTAEILNEALRKKKVIDFDFDSGRYSKKQPDGYSDFINDLPLRITKINSRGKFMWFELTNNSKSKKKTWYIWNTFGLSGRWSFHEPNHHRATIELEDQSVYFSDMRNFGTFKFSKDKAALEKKLQDLSPDFLKDSDFDLNRVKKYDVPIVKILMDQKKIGSGIGNYLAAEILYRAKLSPYRLGSSLSNNEINNLTYWIKYMVKLSYVDNHIGYMIDLEEEANNYERAVYHPDIELDEPTFTFKVYRKKKDPHGNEVKIAKIVSSGQTKRSTYWVPAVQK